MRINLITWNLPVMAPGLGLIPDVIIFAERGRFGRLLGAVALCR